MKSHKIIMITDLSTPELSLYAQRRESALLHYDEPGPGLFLAESPNVIKRALEAGYEPVSFLFDQHQLQSGNQSDRNETHTAPETVCTEERGVSPKPWELWKDYPEVPVYAASDDVLQQITGFSLTRGMLCLMRRRPLSSIEKVCRDLDRIVVLEDVMNPANVGAIFRSAAALGAQAVLLTAPCSDPLYRRAARVSMGTVFQIPWTYFPKACTASKRLDMLKGLGFHTAAMALTDRSVSLKHPDLAGAKKLAVIMGTEGEGLCRETIEGSTYTIKIPMSRGVDSLNVAAASAVAFWELFQERD